MYVISNSQSVLFSDCYDYYFFLLMSLYDVIFHTLSQERKFYRVTLLELDETLAPTGIH